MDFGKYAITTPIEYHFEQEPDWYWRIRPVTMGDEIEMNQWMVSAATRETDDDGKSYTVPPHWITIAMREIAVTFAGTNLEEDGKPILKDDATIEQVTKALEKLPKAMFMEIWKAVGESYPSWGPANPN